MSFTVTLDGLDGLGAAWGGAVASMRSGLGEVSLEAAREGVREAQSNHPYTDRTHDLTDAAHAERTGEDIEMVWPAEYAGFVDRGTKRSKPYPFTPQAEATAEKVLAYGAEHVVDTAIGKV
jgi:hypothetical protein